MRRIGGRTRERGAALILAIIVIFILTVLGLALMFTTTTEFQIAGAETVSNKAFYAADSGVQFAIAQKRNSATVGACSATINSVTYDNFFCFAVPEQKPGVSSINSAASAPSLTVQVSPFTEIAQQQLPKSNLEKTGGNTFWSIGYHFDSYSTDAALNTQKQISVEFTESPVPLPEPK